MRTAHFQIHWIIDYTTLPPSGGIVTLARRAGTGTLNIENWFFNTYFRPQLFAMLEKICPGFHTYFANLPEDEWETQKALGIPPDAKIWDRNMNNIDYWTASFNVPDNLSESQLECFIHNFKKCLECYHDLMEKVHYTIDGYIE